MYVPLLISVISYHPPTCLGGQIKANIKGMQTGFRICLCAFSRFWRKCRGPPDLVNSQKLTRRIKSGEQALQILSEE